MAIHFFAGFYGIAGIFIKDSVKNMCVNSADSALFCFFTVKWIASSVRKDFLAMTVSIESSLRDSAFSINICVKMPCFTADIMAVQRHFPPHSSRFF